MRESTSVARQQSVAIGNADWSIHRNSPPSDFTDLTTGADYIQSPKLVKVRYYRQLPEGVDATQDPKSTQFTA
jgi:hypothetical protein